MAIFKKLPGWGQIAAVYSVIVLMLYTWTILWFFWKIPSWLLFMNVWELLSAFSFAVVTNLLESLVVILALLVPAVILPGRWFKDVFISRATVLAAAGLGWLMVVADQFQFKVDYPSAFIDWTPAVLAAIVVLAFVIGAFPALRKPIEALAENLTVFLFIAIPLSVLALLFIGLDAIF